MIKTLVVISIIFSYLLIGFGVVLGIHVYDKKHSNNSIGLGEENYFIMTSIFWPVFLLIILGVVIIISIENFYSDIIRMIDKAIDGSDEE